jgi:hypothetical protein
VLWLHLEPSEEDALAVGEVRDRLRHVRRLHLVFADVPAVARDAGFTRLGNAALSPTARSLSQTRLSRTPTHTHPYTFFSLPRYQPVYRPAAILAFTAASCSISNGAISLPPFAPPLPTAARAVAAAACAAAHR